MMRVGLLKAASYVALTVFAAAAVVVPQSQSQDQPPKSADADDAAKLPPAATNTVDFVRDIQPIIKAHCYRCHGAEKQESGLRLNAKGAALAGGDYGTAIKPGKGAASPLVLRVAGLGDLERMPPEDDGKPLSRDQVALLRAWVDQGANWPEAADTGVGGQKHWAYIPPRRPLLPMKIVHFDTRRDAADLFILARLDQEGLSPSPEADRERLIRRVTLDLTGLPATLADVEAFLLDDRPDAYERLVDRLLASPQFGERWAAMWLDLARYADTQGYEKDNRRTIWRYRDWVIEALNRNLPWDQFTIEQLAGDLLPNPSTDQLLATAFHRNTMTNTEGGTDDEEFRTEAVADRVNTTMQIWLGTTFNCCRCHSHKYDPFTQREYYRFLAFFNNTEDRDRDDEQPALPTPTRDDQRRMATLAASVAELESLRTASGAAPAPPDAAAHIADLKAQSSSFKPVTTPILRELSAEKRRVTHVHVRGNFLNKGEKVTPGVPAVLHPLAEGTSLNRVGAAKWLVDANNPLTARVLVNRLWEQLFGTGIVKTSEDFGIQGEKPSHADLLDWLATELIRQRWDLKLTLRQMVTSATYRQASRVAPILVERDPENRLLARGPRGRLSAEQVRDQALAVSGLLSDKMLGPSVMPPQPPGVWQVVYSGDQWTTPQGEDKHRRGLYTFWRRTAPYPSMVAFDAPSREFCVLRRPRTNTPLQALVTLNDPVYIEAAQALARRIVGECSAASDSGVDRRVAYGFRVVLARRPSSAETARLVELYQSELTHFRREGKAAAQMAGSELGPPPQGFDVAELAAWTVVANVLLNLDETLSKP